MKKILKLASIICIVLMTVAFFFVGLMIAKITGAAEGQGLAGGAIVLFYALISAAIAFVIAIVLCLLLELKYIKILNWVLLLLTVLVFGYLYLTAPGRKGDSAKVRTAYFIQDDLR